MWAIKVTTWLTVEASSSTSRACGRVNKCVSTDGNKEWVMLDHKSKAAKVFRENNRDAKMTI